MTQAEFDKIVTAIHNSKKNVQQTPKLTIDELRKAHVANSQIIKNRSNFNA